MPTAPRPLSPHLQIYRMQLTSTLSILHRLTGVALALGAVLLVAWLIAAAVGAEAFDRCAVRVQRADEEGALTRARLGVNRPVRCHDQRENEGQGQQAGQPNDWKCVHGSVWKSGGVWSGQYRSRSEVGSSESVTGKPLKTQDFVADGGCRVGARGDVRVAAA